MITPAWVATMARYNRWQNEAVFGLAAGLSDAQRREDLGAFFKSIHATLNHVRWADQMWLWRFGACEAPHTRVLGESVGLYATWDELLAERQRFDRVIADWAAGLTPEWLLGDLIWIAGTTGREMRRPRALTVTHLFNHQTHHRGQVNCILTGLGLNPGVTDLPFMPIDDL